MEVAIIGHGADKEAMIRATAMMQKAGMTVIEASERMAEASRRLHIDSVGAKIEAQNLAQSINNLKRNIEFEKPKSKYHK
ncbi:hypothetical protein [Christiangramia forsetii]|uniref:Uncharacterized protein n=2 Tax=Christiangramia forsetii TaxID=411153 RepID=A0M454_CHRFK|nr:hypothetical protein [Christiangramia forsetii]GGG24221.1 hypothetical protein GCM10011532_04310 [Christiangramia forsetii]CAL67399.1 hypothetical protein GFO_2443 [Christiangramia forsetii KT0803]